MSCAVCGRNLVPGIHWQVRVVRPIPHSLLMVRDIDFTPEMSVPIEMVMLCYPCAKELGYEHEGELSGMNNQAFKHPPITEQRSLSQMERVRAKLALTPSVVALHNYLQDIAAHRAELPVGTQVSVAGALMSYSELMHLLTQEFGGPLE